jgi:S-adenosylmethionine hydrolase
VLALPRARIDQGAVHGEIVRIDRFGNVVTNIDRKTAEKFAAGPLQISVGSHSIARLVSTYSDIATGELGALFGSTDHLEFAAHAASAAEVLGVQVGDPVVVKRPE